MKGQETLRYLERGEHDSMLSVLDAGVHQVFDQADLWPQVPDTEGGIKNNIESDSRAAGIDSMTVYEICVIHL